MKKIAKPAAKDYKKYLIIRPTWRWAVFIILILASLAKLWLTRGQHLDIISVSLSEYDQGMFYNLAQSIHHGLWLGPYNDLTLAKGPFYPLYLVAVNWLRLPLLLSQQLLYILACFAFLLSIQPLLKSQIASQSKSWLSRNARGIITVVLGLLLIFNPMTTDFSSSIQVIREGIYPALTLLTLSLFIALLSYRQARLWKYLLLAIATGFSLSAFWLTREEGLWIDPFMIILGVCIAALIIRRRLLLPHWKWKLAILCVPFLMLWASIFTVSSLNQHYYGVDGVVEFKTPQFLAAYSSLTRVKNNQWLPVIPVSVYQRQLIYKVSPAFAQLKPDLDGGLGKSWALASNMPPPYQGQLNGGTFMWVFRRAVQDAGYYKNGQTAMNYYATLAKQVNAACADKKLACNKSTDSMYPPLDRRYYKPFINTFHNSWFYLAHFTDYDPVSVKDTGDTASIDQIAAFTHESTTNLYGHQRLRALQDIGDFYKDVFPVLTLGAVVAYAVLAILKRPYKDLLFVVTGLIGFSVIFRLALLSIITATSFEGIDTVYLSCVYPLLIIFDVLSLVLVWRWLGCRKAPPAAEPKATKPKSKPKSKKK